MPEGGKKKTKRRKRQRLSAHLSKSPTISLDQGRELVLFILVVKEFTLIDNLSVLIKI